MLIRMLALWNGDQVDAGEVYAEGCRENGETTFGPDDVLPEIRALREAFPDLCFSVKRWFRAGDRFVLLMQTGGTHQGPLTTPLGTAAPNGRSVSMSGIEVFEVKEDRVVDVWVGWNWGEIYSALGATLQASSGDGQ
ncbi:MAG: ester cyclase [Actinobacteria bacterium]|nr:ester cyclase [Actinomycetota bacterium]